MFKSAYQKAKSAGQAATELAVFGAVLIFLLGTIVRTAVGNSYTQNQNLKAMRMAMLASWSDSNPNSPSTAHNSASILIVEDRLSPDFNKYGDLDRNPYIANGAGSFTYQLFYPLDPDEVGGPNLPVMDIYIDGQHFPLSTAAYVQNRTITRPGGNLPPGSPPVSASSVCGTATPNVTYPLSINQCTQNQCLRNLREWAGGIVNQSQFESIVPQTTSPISEATAQANAALIFNTLISEGLVTPAAGAATPNSGYITATFTGTTVQSNLLNTGFPAWFENQFLSVYTLEYPQTPVANEQSSINQIQNILISDSKQYKLFYTRVPNALNTKGVNQFTLADPPPPCSVHPCKDLELSPDLTLLDINGNPFPNAQGEMQFDLLRNGDYMGDATSVDTIFPPASSCATNPPPSLRCNIAWQWAATAGTTATLIGLDTTNDQYPTYDIDGRLKEVTIYAISEDATGEPTVSYEDYQGGDIDSTWDANTCGPKPGLQNSAEIYTFTQNGTILQIKEGQMYNPQSGQVVSSANKRNSIDLIERTIQLSNNTGRFCSLDGTHLCNGISTDPGVTCANPNPVEACGDCFSATHNALTCFEPGINVLYVRSRLEDRRGRSWLTNTSGNLQVH